MNEAIKQKALDVCEILYNKKATDIVAIHVADKTIIADWFIICSGRATQQVKAIADELTLRDEVIDPTKPHVIFDPNATWKTKELTDFTVRELQVPIFQNGELVYELPELNDIKAYCRQQIHTLWDEVKRFENPHRYYVDLSRTLWDERQKLLRALSM